MLVMDKNLYSHDRRQLQRLLRELRKEAGLRQVDLATRLGVPQSFVSKYESGERRLEVTDVIAICSALGLSFVDFARRVEESLK